MTPVTQDVEVGKINRIQRSLCSACPSILYSVLFYGGSFSRIQRASRETADSRDNSFMPSVSRITFMDTNRKSRFLIYVED